MIQMLNIRNRITLMQLSKLQTIIGSNKQSRLPKPLSSPRPPRPSRQSRPPRPPRLKRPPSSPRPPRFHRQYRWPRSPGPAWKPRPPRPPRSPWLPRTNSRKFSSTCLRPLKVFIIWIKIPFLPNFEPLKKTVELNFSQSAARLVFD